MDVTVVPMAKDPIADTVLPSKRQALKVGKMLGCTGAHRKGDGWGLCESDELLRILIKKGSAAYREARDAKGKKSCCRSCEMKANAADEKLIFPTREEAEAAALNMGCSGAHQHGVGQWMPCETMEEFSAARSSPNKTRLVIDVPTMKRRKRIIDLPNVRQSNWEPLGGRGIRGVETLAGGGLVASKRFYTTGKRSEYAASGVAMKDGSYPIRDVGDLRNAIQAFGRAKNKPAAKKHIKKRARALKRTDLLPDTWKDS